MDGKTPQWAVDMFWKSFHTKAPGKATAVIPNKKIRKSKMVPTPVVPVTQSAEASYEAAAATCRAKVAKIVQDCRRVNRKYRDPHFNIEFDLRLGQRDCLQSLSNDKPNEETGAQPPRPGSSFAPRSAKRVTEIFTKPQFYINGPTANDVRQGNDGDCWLMAALCALSFKKGLIEKLCVAHDQDVGVYGFVFHRDGEWISEIVDDFLYLTKSDYDDAMPDRLGFEELEYRNPQEAYRRIFQSNSNSLYFAQCEHPQETWLPLLEKCYAKAHGDYAAIEGGLSGEGIEDLTGGVASDIFATDILDKEHFWKQLLQANKEFLFGCSTGVFGSGFGSRQGIIEGHAYSVQRVVEIDGQRLVSLRNPWGKGEWKGAWSDGSKEWTPEWMQKLGHKFGEDGEFWICYEDLLRTYQCFERVRLFGPEWNVSQIWTTLHVPWVQEYNETYFTFTTDQSGPVVIMVSQLDERYFRGLEGQYWFQLSFRVHKAGHAGYIVRSETAHRMRRSANVELDLEAGAYEVYVKIKAWRDDDVMPVDATIRYYAKNKRDKVSRIGKAYDLAHSRGQIIETKEEKRAREAYEARKLKKRRDAAKRDLKKRFEQTYYQTKKNHERSQARAAKKKEKMKAKKEAKAKAKEERKAARAAVKEAAAKKLAEKKVEKDEAAEKKEAPMTNGDATPEKKEAGEDAFVEVKKQEVKETEEEKGKKEEASKPESTEETREETKAEAKEEAKEESKEEHKEGAKEGTKEDSKEEPKDDSSSSESESESDNESLAEYSDYSDGELDIQIDAMVREDPTMFDTSEEESHSDEENDSFAADPWNAVAVVGLRVYQKASAAGAAAGAMTLGVVRPNPYVDSDDEDDEGSGVLGNLEGKAKGSVLDVDDSAMDATLEGGLKEKKEVIMGDRKTPA